MVCNRCIRVVKEGLEQLGFQILNIDLGSATIKAEHIDLLEIKTTLEKAGFELIEDKKYQLVDKVKSIIVDLIHGKGLEGLTENLSKYISEKVGKDYHYLSTLFSSTENITIEKFVILQKIEKVKELLVYDELSLSEISYQLDYSSVGHLSRQFKQFTGFTPNAFKKLKAHKRKSLDSVQS